jgi:chromosome segregation ATPase
MAPLTREDLRAELKPIGESVRRVEDRLLRHERELGEHTQRLNAIDQFVAGLEIVDPNPPEETEPQRPVVLTRRDLKIVVGTVVGLGTIIFGWQQALELLLNYLKISLK